MVGTRRSDNPGRMTKNPEIISPLVPGAKQDGLFVRPIDLDTVGLNARVILESLVDDAPIERVERLQLHHIPPAANLLGSLFGLLDQGLPRLSPVAADV